MLARKDLNQAVANVLCTKIPAAPSSDRAIGQIRAALSTGTIPKRVSNFPPGGTEKRHRKLSILRANAFTFYILSSACLDPVRTETEKADADNTERIHRMYLLRVGGTVYIDGIFVI